MTLEKQIELLKEWHERAEMYLPIMSSEDIDRFLRWLEDYKQLKADYIELDNKLRTANTENDELKQLLRLAVDDLDKSIKACETDMLCEICSYEAECNCVNYCFIDKNLRSWKHRDEAMKLIGGTENAEN